MTHEPMLALGATVPGLHAVCWEIPLAAKEPGCVGMQSSIDVALSPGL